MSTEGNGSTTIWMESESIPGRMAENTKGSIKMIKSKGMGYTRGLMVECTRVTGGEANSTGLGRIQCLESHYSSDYGKKASA